MLNLNKVVFTTHQHRYNTAIEMERDIFDDENRKSERRKKEDVFKESKKIKRTPIKEEKINRDNEVDLGRDPRN